MTIQSSGSMLYPATLNGELRRSGSLTTPDAMTRWLAEVPTGPVVIPTDFYDKSAVKLVASYGHGSAATSFSQSGVNFGPAYSGRRIIIVVNTAFNAAHSLDMTSVSIGGQTGSGADHGTLEPSIPGSAGVGIFMANPSGSSGTISFNTANNARARVWVLSVAGITTRHDYDWSTVLTNPGASRPINIPANGVLIAGFTRYSTASHSYGGVTNRGNSEFNVGTARGSYAWTNRLNAQSGRTVSASSASGTYAFIAASYT